MLKTDATVMIHLYGPSGYHCDQSGDSATIKLGEDGNITLSASSEDFLLLSKTCKEAAKRIALKKFNQVSESLDKELEAQFPEI